MSTAPVTRDDQIEIMATTRARHAEVVQAWKSNAAFLESLMVVPPKAFEGSGCPTAHRKAVKCG